MIYLILSEDKHFSENLCLRVNINGAVKLLYVVCYVENRDDAEDYCKLGGFFPGTRTRRFNFQALKKIGEE
jgi:hypothetical protein